MNSDSNSAPPADRPYLLPHVIPPWLQQLHQQLQQLEQAERRRQEREADSFLNNDYIED